MNITQVGIDLAKLVFKFTGSMREVRSQCASN